MPKTLWNYDSCQTAVINNESPGVLPGQSRVFSDEELAIGFTGTWGDKDPRRGLAEERAWKKKRDASVEVAPEQPLDSEDGGDQDTSTG